jgi:hypothetical protein
LQGFHDDVDRDVALDRRTESGDQRRVRGRRVCHQQQLRTGPDNQVDQHLSGGAQRDPMAGWTGPYRLDLQRIGALAVSGRDAA